MHQIDIDKYTYYLPENWNELTVNQLRYLVRLTSSNLSIEEMKTSMVLYCLNATMGTYSILHEEHFKLILRKGLQRKTFYLTAEQILALSGLFNFLTRRLKGKEKKQFYINPQLTLNPYPTFRIGFYHFYGPDNGLVDINYEQFSLLLHYQDCMKQDPQQIDYLIATLFHRKKKFSPDHIESDARIIRKLHPEKKMLLYWFYLGSIQWLASLYPRVFSGGGKASGNIYEAQLRVVDCLAGSDMTKKPAVRNGNVLDALVSMEESIRRQEEQEEKSLSKR